MKRRLVDRDQPNISNERELREQQKIVDGYGIMELLKVGGGDGNTSAMERVHIAYIKNFGDKKVHFNLNSNQRQITKHPDHILVEGREMCRLYLQFFSRSIFKILIMYDAGDSNSANRAFNEDLFKHCANSLSSIAFKCAQPMPITFQGFQGVFGKVKIVRLENVNLGDQLPTLVNLFPNTSRLVLQDVSMIDNSAPFQLLRTLEIGYTEELTCHRLDEVRSLLGSNSTLLYLLIVMPNVEDMNMEFLLDLIGNNRILLELTVETKVVDEPVQAEQIRRLGKYGALEKLNLKSFRMVRDYANYLWQNLKRLRLFSIRIVKYVIDTPTQENPLLTRTRQMPQDDPVTFNRTIR